MKLSKMNRINFKQPNKKLADAFKANLICENKRRFMVLLIIILLSQFAFLAFEIIDKTIWTSGLLLVRGIIICICFFFMGLLYLLNRIKKKKTRQNA